MEGHMPLQFYITMPLMPLCCTRPCFNVFSLRYVDGILKVCKSIISQLQFSLFPNFLLNLDWIEIERKDIL